jgi:hypothetical protein
MNTETVRNIEFSEEHIMFLLLNIIGHDIIHDFYGSIGAGRWKNVQEEVNKLNKYSIHSKYGKNGGKKRECKTRGKKLTRKISGGIKRKYDTHGTHGTRKQNYKYYVPISISSSLLGKRQNGPNANEYSNKKTKGYFTPLTTMLETYQPTYQPTTQPTTMLPTKQPSKNALYQSPTPPKYATTNQFLSNLETTTETDLIREFITPFRTQSAQRGAPSLTHLRPTPEGGMGVLNEKRCKTNYEFTHFAEDIANSILYNYFYYTLLTLYSELGGEHVPDSLDTNINNCKLFFIQSQTDFNMNNTYDIHLHP